MNAFRTPEDLWDLPPAARTLAPRPSSDAPHAVIIGSGFGGLASAVRLAATSLANAQAATAESK